MTEDSSAHVGDAFGAVSERDYRCGVDRFSSGSSGGSIPTSIAHFARLREGDDAPGGINLGFFRRPEAGFDSVFRRIATPQPHAVLSAGHTLIGGADKSAGAWMVRFGAEHAYLIHVRQNSDLDACLIDGAEPEAQKVHLEQVTFRFARAAWADHAPALFDEAARRVKDRPARTLGISTDPLPVGPAAEEALSLTEPGNFDLSSVRFPLTAPLVLTGTAVGSNGADGMRRVLAQLPAEARARTPIAWNLIGRVPGPVIQIFPSPGGDHPDGASDACLSWHADRRAISEAPQDPSFAGLLDAAHRSVTTGSGQINPGRSWHDIRRALIIWSPLASLPLDHADERELILVSRVIDRAIDLAGGRDDLHDAGVALWDHFAWSLCAMLPALPPALMSDIAELDFAPVLLSDLMDQGTPLSDRLLGEMWRLQQSAPRQFSRLSGRMPVPSRCLPTTWDLLMQWESVVTMGKAIKAAIGSSSVPEGLKRSLAPFQRAFGQPRPGIRSTAAGRSTRFAGSGAGRDRA